MSAKSFYEQYYSQIDADARHWRERSGAAKARNIMAVVGDTPVQNILEIGAGTGSVIAYLARSGFGSRYWAIDVAEEAVALVRQRGDIPGLVEARVFDGQHIPYEDQCFDLAVLSHVIEHLADPRPLLLEAARVARYIAVEVPLEDNLYTFLKVRVFKSDYREQIGHIQWMSLRSFRRLLQEACGLDILRMEVVYVPDELYFIRKQGVKRSLVSAMLGMRKAVRALSDTLYTRLMTDHCIALVRSRL